MKIRDFVRSLVEDFKAHRRGEKRIAPRGARGRVYGPKAGASDPTGSLVAPSRSEGRLTMTITRADGNVERVIVPAQVIHNG